MARRAITDGSEEALALVTKALIFCEQAGFELVTMLLRDAADVLQQNEE